MALFQFWLVSDQYWYTKECFSFEPNEYVKSDFFYEALHQLQDVTKVIFLKRIKPGLKFIFSLISCLYKAKEPRLS